MAKGGKRAGAGRPKGSTTRPQLRDYFDDKDRADVVELLKTHMVEDMGILKHVSEQLFGKAAQAIDITSLGESVNGSVVNLPNEKLEELSAG